ncbi:MAG: transporter [Rhodospirillales bacterium]|nr:transporter [Rhodospirillales bacterium]
MDTLHQRWSSRAKLKAFARKFHEMSPNIDLPLRIRNLHHQLNGKSKNLAVAAFFLFATAAPSLAMQKGVGSDYAPGYSIGNPLAMMQPAGLYWGQKASFSTAQSVNNAGADSGVHTNMYLTTSMLMWTTNYRFLGARYGAYAYNIGVSHANITTASHKTGDATSANDFEFDPVYLSWKLNKHIFASISEGFNAPIGSYDATRLINIGHDRYTFQQHVNLAYISSKYLVVANGVISVNTPNRHYNYTSGATYDIDLTAARKFGAFLTGPVGYAYNQFGTDSGPSNLNAGKPVELAAGWLVGYKIGNLSLNTYITQDVYARNIGKQTKLWVSLLYHIE